MLKLMYITNRPEVAQIAEAAGVDRIFVDMEFIGKDQRQKGLDTVKSHHTAEDVAAIRKAVGTAQVLVRINPIHDALPDYCSSKDEIDAVVAAGADVIMLPYFKTAAEARTFVRLVDGRARTMLLLETPEAAERADEILAVDGVDEIHIGLNDLSLGLGLPFMFQLLSNGTVERLCRKFREANILYGFGGIAAPGGGALPAEYIIREHCRLGSGCAILSRSFCDTSKITDLGEIRRIFTRGVAQIREVEWDCQGQSDSFFSDNQRELCRRVRMISERIAAAK